MKFEKANTAEVNKLFRRTKLNKLLDEFNESDEKAVIAAFEEGEYSSIASAQSCLARSIKRFGYKMSARSIHGKLYLIKLE